MRFSRRLRFLFLILLQLLLMAEAQAQGLFFRQIENQQGLSHHTVTAITQDDMGFIWIGTADGLNRYDGYSLKVFKPLHGLVGSISDNKINALATTQNQLWVATKNGLEMYNNQTETFKSIPQLYGNPVFALQDTSDGNLWLATSMGLRLLNTTSETLIELALDPSAAQPPTCFALFANDLWMGSSSGVSLFQQHSNQILLEMKLGKVTALLNESRESHWIASEQGVSQLNTHNQNDAKIVQTWDLPELASATSLAKDLDGRIWLGSAAGLFRYLPSQSVWNPMTVHREGQHSRLSGITQLFVDRSGLLWVGTQRMGLFLHEPKSDSIRHYALPIDSPVHAFVHDRNDRLWIAAADDLYTMDLKQPQARPILRKGKLDSDITCMHLDPQNLLYLGTHRRGLLRFNLATDQLTSVPNTESVRSVNHMVDFSQALWLATPKGLYRFDPTQGALSSWHVDQGLPSENVYCLLADRQNELYLGGDSCLIAYSPEMNSFRSWRWKQHQNTRLRFQVLHQNKPDEVWIGTPQGLFQFDRRRETFRPWTTADGLPNDDIRGLATDAHEQLWVSTQQGLARLAPGAIAFSSFSVNDGALASDFLLGAALHTGSDLLFFGGQEGFNLITPSLLVPTRYQPELVFTQFKIQNAIVKPDSEGPLTQSIEATRFIDMPYGHYLLSFEFAALDFANPEHNLYAYKLEGQEKDWTYVNASSRSANFTHLEPGAYTLRVKGSNRDGAWSSEEASLFLVIRPPWWRTTWAYVIYGILLLAGISVWPMVHIHATKNRRLQLERLIASRNRDLEFKNNELRNMNQILRAINETMNRDSLMGVLLEKGSLLVPRSEKSRFLFLDDREQCYRFSASAGYPEPDLAKIQLTRDQALAYYAPETQRMAPGIYNISQDHIQQINEHLESPSSTLSMTLMVGPTLAGFLIFDNFSDTRAFDQSDVERLLRLREHAVTATSRIMLMEELQQTTHHLTETRGQLMEAAHLAGRTDTITSLLHNIGNALNSLNVSATVIHKEMASSETLDMFGRLTTMLDEHRHDLPGFFSQDPRALKLAQAFKDIYQLMGKGREFILQEMDSFTRTMETICNIINAEQRYANGNYLEEEVNLNELIDNILLMLGDSLTNDEIKISWHCQEPLMVRVQRPKFIQVIVNLIQNAREAMLIQPAELGRQLNISASPSGRDALILISDNGPGMDALVMTKIFHQGYSTKIGGNGYGLHYCANAMSEMNGSIRAENLASGGACFALTLPLSLLQISNRGMS